MTRLDFTTGLPGGVSVSSSPAGYAKTSSGTLTSFSSNAGRRTDLGILLEPAATNIALNSQDLTTGTTVSGCVVTANQSTAPDGTTTAEKLVENNGVNLKYLVPTTGLTITAGTWTSSFYVKNTGFNLFYIDCGDGVSNGVFSGNLNLTTGAIGAAGSYGSGYTLISEAVESLGSGWYRLSLTYSVASTKTVYPVCIFPNSPNGNGTNGVFLWNWQTESGSVASSPISTAGSSVTRAADVITWTVPAGVTSLVYTFDDNSTQTISVSSGAYTFPTNLNRPQVKYVDYVQPILAATDTTDTAAVSANVFWNAPLAATDTTDAAAVSVIYESLLSFASTETADSAAISIAHQVSLAATDTSDSAAISIAHQVTLGVTEAADTAAISTGTVSSLTLAATDSGDTATMSLTVVNEARFTTTETQDTASVTASTTTNASLAATDTADTAAISANIGAPFSLATTDGADATTVSVSTSTSAALAVTDSSDTASATASVVTNATFASTESTDVAALSASWTLVINASATETSDTASINAALALPFSLSTSESPDAISLGVIWPLAVGIATSEGGDKARALVNVDWPVPNYVTTPIVGRGTLFRQLLRLD